MKYGFDNNVNNEREVFIFDVVCYDYEMIEMFVENTFDVE